MPTQPYSRSAEVYDLIYEEMKDYEAEAKRIHQLIQEHERSDDSRLLDVACGTGLHLQHLRRYYEVTGMDISVSQLEIAERRLRELGYWSTSCPPLHRNDMRTFEFPERYGAISCLFSAIGHMQTEEELSQAIGTMARHLVPGGVLIVEPWIAPSQFRDGTRGLELAEDHGLKVARYSRSVRKGDLSILNFQYCVQREGEDAETFCERFTLGLFTHEQYLGAFEAAGLETTYDSVGLSGGHYQGRGLYIGTPQMPPPGGPGHLWNWASEID